MWQEERARWREYLAENDPEMLKELDAQDEKEAMEAFAGKMAFGTGGLRSVLGVGPARMNVYTVARATQGLAQAILKSKAPHTVAIAYDTRKNSDVFALTAARVLMANGIKAVLWEQPVPTPVLSYTVRAMGLGWGIVITASHNPKQYNGYKVYDERGVQVIPEQAELIMKEIETVEFFQAKMLPLEEGEAQGLLEQPEGILDRYLDELYFLLPRTSLTRKRRRISPWSIPAFTAPAQSPSPPCCGCRALRTSPACRWSRTATSAACTCPTRKIPASTFRRLPRLRRSVPRY